MKREWRPDVPLRSLPDATVASAEKLRRAFEGTWARFAAGGVSQSVLERMGMDDYQRVFGHSISGRHWRRLFRMIRDRGARGRDTDPIGLYLPRRVRAVEGVAGREQSGPDLAALRASVATLSDPRSILPGEKALLWDAAFREFEANSAAGGSKKTLRRQIIDYLNVNAPGLGAGAGALLRNWQRQFRAWKDHGRSFEALMDGRTTRTQAKGIPQADVDSLMGIAVFETGGRLSEAWRLARERGRLSPETSERFSDEVSRHDYVPKAGRTRVAPSLPALAEYLRGPRAGRLAGAYIERDWSAVAAGDWYQADDVTWPVYYYVTDENGHRLTRGQCLVMIDLRSRRILDFVLIDEKSYDGLRIRRLMNRVCDRFGLPRHGFAFEGGIWEKARIVTGGRRSGAPDVWEVESGFRALGVSFQHSRTPRAKPVERVLGLSQDLMEGVPGYCGRNEMVDRFERVHRAKLDVEAGRKHPAEAGFLSAEEWFKELEAICERYNASVQSRSGSIRGLTPDQAWREFQRQDDPLVRLPDEARHLMATHRFEKLVGRQGIRFTLGKHTFTYRGAATGERMGEKVLVWFDPERPESCTITDLDKRNPRVVPSAPSAPAMGASREEMAQAMQSVNSHERPIRERFSRLRADFLPPTRANVVAAEVAELGREMASQTAALEIHRKEAARDAKAIRQGFSGTLPPDRAAALAADIATDPARVEATKRLSEILGTSEPT